MDTTRVTGVRQVALIAFLLTSYLSGSHFQPISNFTKKNIDVVQSLVGNVTRAINDSLRQLCPGIGYPRGYSESTCLQYADTIVTAKNSEIGGGNITVNHSRGQNQQVILHEWVQNLKLQYNLLATVEYYINETYTTSKPGLTLCGQAKTNVWDLLTRPEVPSVLGAKPSMQPVLLSPYPVPDFVNWHLGALRKSLKGFSVLKVALVYKAQTTGQSPSS